MSLKSPSARPTASEFGLLRACLAQAGVSQTEIDKVIGTTVSGRTRGQISAALLSWLAQLSRPLNG